MCEPSSDETSLPSIILQGQRLITEYFRHSNLIPRRKRPLPPTKETPPKRVKFDKPSDSEALCADESISVYEVNNEAMDYGKIKISKKVVHVEASPVKLRNTNGVKSSVTTRFATKQSASKHSVELKSDPAGDQSAEKVGASTASWTRSEINHSSSSERGSDLDETDSFKGTDKMNLEFYRNKIRSVPDGDFIENILLRWPNDFGRLEQHHGYIQWLFPIKESGMNSCAQVLEDDEAEAIKEDPVLKDRVLRAYKMMLGFYGLMLEDDEEGTVGPSKLYKSRIAHLNSSFHNNLRITRILKALGELGYEHLKKPLVTFLLEESFQKNTLVNCRKSCLNYWIPTIADEKEREALEKLAKGNGEQETRRPNRNHRKWLPSF